MKKNTITFEDYAQTSEAAKKMLKVIENYNKVLTGMEEDERQYFSARDIGEMITGDSNDPYVGGIYARRLKEMGKLDMDKVKCRGDVVLPITLPNGEEIKVQVKVSKKVKFYSLV
ncbi:MAG: hypothetical protein NC548_22915 [Lachnospiraceae bacterium]|nr:hypothetical protein [Lachnospiraceae bacterium]